MDDILFQLKPFVDSLYNFIGLDPSDRGETFLFIMALYALCVGFWALYNAKRLSGAGASSRLNKSLNDLSIKFSDFSSKSEKSQIEMLAEIQKLTEKVLRLENRLDNLDSSKTAKESEDSTKKKTKPVELEAQQSETSSLSKLEQSISELQSSSAELSVAAEEVAAATSITGGLEKTRNQFFSRLASVFSSDGRIGEGELASLEELLITSDMGVQTTNHFLDVLKEKIANQEEINLAGLKSLLRQQLTEILKSEKSSEIIASESPFVVFVVGVNGVGKTTTVGKLASKFISQDKKVLLAACDTFRAAADEQLRLWSERAGATLESGKEGEKPATVAYRAVNRAKEENYDVLIVDTAGRLHTKKNLMNELESVRGIIERELGKAPQETILVVDASTGQNALQQAKEFNAAAKLSGIIVTKLDGTPKGGIVVAIKKELGVPIRYVGVGEGVEDLKTFSAEEFVDGLLLDSGAFVSEESKPSAHARVRRKRREALG